jgi:hypothetical protein
MPFATPGKAVIGYNLVNDERKLAIRYSVDDIAYP